MYPVKTCQWATPLVVVPTPDSSVRLCGKYEVTVNHTISEEQYPIPNIDMFVTLAGGKKFTKLDLSQAYLQLELDQESEEYLIVNTSLALLDTSGKFMGCRQHLPYFSQSWIRYWLDFRM